MSEYGMLILKRVLGNVKDTMDGSLCVCGDLMLYSGPVLIEKDSFVYGIDRDCVKARLMRIKNGLPGM